MRVVMYQVDDIILVVPEQLRDKVVSENHDALFSGHFQLKRCYKN